MHIERKKLDYSAILRGLRAMTGIDQGKAAKLAGLSLRTIQMAESGQASSKTIAKLLSLYQGAGLRLYLLPGLYDEAVPVVAFDSDVSPVISAKA